MPSSSIDLQQESITVSLRPERVPGFILSAQRPDSESGQLAKALASGFLKFTPEGQTLAGSDSVQRFIALSALHREVSEDAANFLKEAVPLVCEDQPLHPLLLSFSLYRLRQARQHYAVANLENQPEAVLAGLTETLRRRQAEYDLIIATH